MWIKGWIDSFFDETEFNNDDFFPIPAYPSSFFLTQKSLYCLTRKTSFFLTLESPYCLTRKSSFFLKLESTAWAIKSELAFLAWKTIWGKKDEGAQPESIRHSPDCETSVFPMYYRDILYWKWKMKFLIIVPKAKIGINVFLSGRWHAQGKWRTRGCWPRK